MLSTSLEFRSKVAESSRVLVKATLTLADGTVENLTGDDIADMSFSEATSSASSFDVGAAVIGRIDVTLNNYDERFGEYDFTGAEIVPYVGIELDAIDSQTGEHQVEWLRKGVYGVDQPDSYGGTISLSCLDNMRLLEVPYSEVTATTYPATLATIVSDICSKCGMTLLSSAFANSAYSVARRPDDGSVSCLDMVSFAAQVSGNFAKCDTYGRMSLKWYNTTAFEGEDWLDGDQFDAATPYASGDTADGGSFTDYSSGASKDGGALGMRTFAYIHAISQAVICTDDVVVTGIRVTAQDQVKGDGSIGAEGETHLSGSDGYVLEISGNPLVEYGKASTVAAQVAARVVGMRFRPFDISALGDPAAEAGDPAVVVDGRQNQYFSYLTSADYKVGGFERFACAAETPSRNSAATYSAMTKAVVQARQSARCEMTSREIAVQMLQTMLGASAGLYRSSSIQQDGSAVLFLHDKPTLGASQTIWKATADAFGVSTDGGSTYTYGIDSNGVAILNQIYAAGINADYIKTGALTVRSNGRTIFEADVSNGTVTIDAPSVLVGTRQAFANDSTNITVNAGTVTFNSNTFVVNSTHFSVTSSGVITATSGTIGGFTLGSQSLTSTYIDLSPEWLTFKDGSRELGRIGRSSYVERPTDPSYMCVVVDDESMGFGICETTGPNDWLTPKLEYVPTLNPLYQSSNSGMFYCSADFSIQDHDIWLSKFGDATGIVKFPSEGVSGTYEFLAFETVVDDGGYIIGSVIRAVQLTYKYGILTGAKTKDIGNVVPNPMSISDVVWPS